MIFLGLVFVNNLTFVEKLLGKKRGKLNELLWLPLKRYCREVDEKGGISIDSSFKFRTVKDMISNPDRYEKYGWSQDTVINNNFSINNLPKDFINHQSSIFLQNVYRTSNP